MDASAPFAVECEQLEEYRGVYSGPAARLGVLRQPGEAGGRFVVAVNQDLDGMRSATLMADAEAVGADAVFVDLIDDTEPVPAGDPLTLTLDPGDGRVLFCGTLEQATAVREAVRAERAAILRPIFRLDADIAGVNDVDTGEAERLAEGGQIPEAMAALERADGMAAIREQMDNLERVQELLSPVAQVFRDNWDVVVPPADREGVPEFGVWRSTQDPRMQQYVDEVAQAFLDRIALMRRIRHGEAMAVVADVDALLAQAERLNEEAIAYVREKAG